ncbi:hypothetical protein A2210_00750 [Candidatus Woesebacteria bacterium RIFOXYA1_FULL_40_18]|uniref:Uncharacterized protein n=4 Tax=Candidatus Woeseibacteriota TaxID=1752722 RepID=A0A0G0SDP2_9BACT|nr:MAG: hypothetical protein UU03_C0014G0003 [Candidatus Woesebacteria bacterium GW2011_GWA1_40_45]OGM76103.1 MAG: hypothetical protein A2210_00750 [Candidatus Woesebacteria bacterium RIFOXYA1_FULL_40_18]OGM80589.1 MAG: hypothetical protein A2361_00485 [Candidatus Woesebacteria bacterium RIFOXYB1_FULL_40_26]OGM87346.1 MAG: hypothetical protein A2614_02635 [Candidatus Woesebacteria bacterium RIFOXYD1_FULL_40_21]
MAEDSEVSKSSVPVGLLLKVAPIVVAILLGVGLTVYGIKLRPEVLGLSKGQAQVQAEVDALVAEVDKLIDLPKDEKPTVATITDIEKVKDQPFFKNAKNGDRVLIFTNAKKAILYRPTEKRIIEVGAVNINQASPTPAGEPTPEGETPAASATPEVTSTPEIQP